MTYGHVSSNNIYGCDITLNYSLFALMQHVLANVIVSLDQDAKVQLQRGVGG